jgi:hypothetical protein
MKYVCLQTLCWKKYMIIWLRKKLAKKMHCEEMLAIFRQVAYNIKNIHKCIYACKLKF